ncbi:HlyD family secretion protein [Rodentibacter genomosp. 2]|uniref:HlyD family secretion protein n=1 Tax=Rodentibacter genomosp. 2 TaxID=1908266 RepID=A0A1V3JPI3_9PAST|nr:HlyD family efflux transporter periplasmic adaptor subunit [Rodentibacter genomosp. 2]OOF58548.1 HlyD family secretion protein [Rodentibacter genomosp. 2]
MKTKYLILGGALASAAGLAIWQNQRLQADELVGIVGINGRIELKRLDIATLYAGRVEEILVQEGDQVKPHQSLARLSSSQSESQLAAAQAQKQRAEENVTRTLATVEAQQQQANVEKLELDNATKLRREKLVSDSELLRRQSNYKAALATIATAQAAVAEAKAGVAQAQAQLEHAQSQNDDMLIRSPKAGWVEYLIAEPGNVLGMGGRVLSLLDPTDTYLNVFLTSEQLNQVKVGDEARIVLDGVDAVFPAQITFTAANAQFTPKTVETAEERAKLMFRVKLQMPKEIALQYERRLKGGMTAVGYVKYDSQAAWPSHLQVKLPIGNE